MKLSSGVRVGANEIIGRLGPEYVPLDALIPALRLTVSPDGKSLTYSTRKSTCNLWFAEGLNAVTLR